MKRSLQSQRVLAARLALAAVWIEAVRRRAATLPQAWAWSGGGGDPMGGASRGLLLNPWPASIRGMVTLRVLLVVGVLQLSAVCFAEKMPALDTPHGLPSVAKSVDEICYVGLFGLLEDGSTVRTQPRKERFTYAGREYLVASECNLLGGDRCRCRAYLYALDSRTGDWRCVRDRRLSGHLGSFVLDAARGAIVAIEADPRGRPGRRLAAFSLGRESRGRFHKNR